MPRVPPRLTANARVLRRNATDAERSLWRLLSRARPRFTRQLVVGRYIVDLACREARLAVELDGSQHQEQQAYDEERTAFLVGLGWRVMRFWNSDVTSNIASATPVGFLAAVEERLRAAPRWKTPLPARREGPGVGLPPERSLRAETNPPLNPLPVPREGRKN